jgi:uncharacterized surface protein with fasciclin (FAS1) repeats
MRGNNSQQRILKTETMNSKKSYDIFRAFNLLVFCVLMLLTASCRKEEFMPVPEGEIVPSGEATASLKEVLDASSYTFFKAAWARSTMDARIKALGERTKFTLLVPTDAAFLADGMTLEKIKTASPELLDELLMYHTIASSVNPRDLAERLDNTIEKSILPNPDLRVKPISPFNSGGSDPYFYRQYLKVQQGHLYLNGKDAGDIQPTPAKNGILWPINRLMHKPTKTFLEALEADSRFEIYVDVMRRCSDLYFELTEYNLERPWTPGLVIEERGSFYPNMDFGSVLAPTNAAFQAAGFADADAVMEFNKKRGLPYVDWDRGEVVGMFASDSLLTLHRWSDLIFPASANYPGGGTRNSTCFYSNDFNNDLLGNYVLRDSGREGTLPLMIMPLEFGKAANGAATIKAKGSKHTPAVVVDGDINTLMGPIHAVDHLIPLADFKF